jgi:hypothetical protein
MTGLRLAALAVLIMSFVGSRTGGAARELRVCADPNNLPFSTSGRRASRTGSRSWSS